MVIPRGHVRCSEEVTEAKVFCQLWSVHMDQRPWLWAEGYLSQHPLVFRVLPPHKQVLDSKCVFL